MLDTDALTLGELRAVSDRFARGTATFDEWQCELACSLGELYEDDRPRSGLPEEARVECEFYLEWLRAASSERFRNYSWVYGSLERNGWINKSAFQQHFAGALRDFRSSVTNSGRIA